MSAKLPALGLDYGTTMHNGVQVYWHGPFDSRVLAAADHIQSLAWADKSELVAIYAAQGDLQLQFTVSQSGWIPDQLEEGAAYTEPVHGDSWSISYSGILPQAN